MAAWRYILILLAAVGLVFVGVRGCQSLREAPSREIVTINGETFQLELATDHHARTRGLMERAEIPADGGMLFIFPNEQTRAFWMGNCLTDIDVIFLTANGRVTSVHEMKAEPPRAPGESLAEYEARMPRYSSERPAMFAIELRAGSLDRLGVKPGDRIDIDYLRLKDLAR